MTAGSEVGHHGLAGRARELNRLTGLAAEARSGRSSVLVVVGEAGVGKTTLLDAVASAVTVPVVRARGVEPGDAPAYSAVAQLSAPLRHYSSALSAEQAGVLSAAAGWEPAAAIERFSVGAALVALLAAAARGGGLVVLVDDAGFLDPASLEALTFTSGRLGSDGIVMLFAARPGDQATSALSRHEVMILGGLDQRAAAELVASRAGAPVDAAVAQRLSRATAGNALALSELALSLSPDQLAGRDPLPHPLPAGERFQEAFTAQIADLSDQAAQALLVVAASFGRAEVLAGALTRLGLSTSDLETARAAGLLLIEEGTVDFRHPLLRSAVYFRASPQARRAVHLALAEANGQVGDLERQAWHVVRGAEGPSEEAVNIAQAAARQAQARGGLAEAAAGYQAAASLCADGSRRADCLLEAGTLWLLAGRVEASRAVAEDLLADSPSDSVRARAALLRGRSLLVGASEEEGRRYLHEEMGRAGAAAPGVILSMAVAVSASALRAGLVVEALQAAEAARGRASSADATLALIAEAAWLTARAAGGDRAAGDQLKVLLKEMDRSGGLTIEMPFVQVNAGLALVWAGDHQGAAWLLGKLERSARANLAIGLLPAVLTTRALLAFRSSQWQVAEAAATEALDLATQTGETALVPYASAVLATVEAALGRAETCRARSLALLDGPARSIPLVRTGALAALGLLELGEGRPAEALRWFEVLAGSQASPPRVNPQIVLWGGDMAESLILTGQLARARWVTDQLAEAAARSAEPRAAAVAERCRGMLADDDAQAERLFAAALRHYGGPERSFGRARTELVRGERLRLAGRHDQARTRLERAQRTFSELGARGWAERAASELARIGGGPGVKPRPELSPRELQVATAAAMGGGPSDIAAGLFLSQSTVEGHLLAAMAKLGVDTVEGLRTVPGLIDALAATPVQSETEPERTQSRLGTGIRLLGAFELARDGKALPVPPPMAAQIVKYVALLGPVPAEELVEQLWPDAPPGSGANRLRSLLTRLRQTAGPMVVRDREWLTLAEDVVVDASQFEASASAALAVSSSDEAGAARLAADAVALYRGELLPADRHLSFTAGPRERLKRRHLAVMGLLVARAISAGATDRAVALLEDAISADPLDEGHYLRAASVLIDAGRKGEAVGMLRRARAAMAELGLPLSARGAELERLLR